MGIADQHRLVTQVDRAGSGITIISRCSCGLAHDIVSFRVGPDEPVRESVECAMACVIDAHEHHVAVVTSDATLAGVEARRGWS